MFPADGRNVKLGKGTLLLERYDSVTGLPAGGLIDMGNASAIGVSSEATFAELFSSKQASAGLVAKNRTQLSFNVVATFNEFTLNNLELFLIATGAEVAQSSGTDEEITFTDVIRGHYYELGARNVTGVVGVEGVTPLVLGTDYLLNSEFGTIQILEGSTVITTDGDTDVEFTFDQPAKTIDKLRIGTAGSQYARLVYLADDANSDNRGAHDRLELWKVDIAPDGELGLISDEYGSFNLTMAVVSDGVNHPTEPYGSLQRVQSA